MVTLLNHPLIEHKLAMIRKRETAIGEFRENMDGITELMAFEVTKDLPLREIEIETPLKACVAREIAREIILIPILRAGLGMVDGFKRLIPSARLGHIGLYRDHQTLEPVCYYSKLPEAIAEAVIILLDPMLATGGSASLACTALKKEGARILRLVSIVGAPEGVRRLERDHPDVDLFLAALDEGLDRSGYILPGLGDAGDRLFGTP